MNDLPKINIAQIRVRYEETDAMGIVWHGNYLRYFEVGRTELARDLSVSTLVFKNIFFVAKSLSIEYHLPAKFDELLTIKTELKTANKLKIVFRHEILKERTLLTTGEITCVCINNIGEIQPVPKNLRTNI